MNESYEILSDIEKLGIVEKIFRYECPRCNETQNYNSLLEVENELICKSCGYSEKENVYNPRSTLDALILIYRVKKE